MSTGNGNRPQRTPNCTSDSKKREINSLVDSIGNGQVVALGHWDRFPMNSEWRRVPTSIQLKEWETLLDAAMQKNGIAIMIVTGTVIQEQLHTAVLNAIAKRLPNSSLIALNVGEFDASEESYDALALALADPACIVGHLYFRDPVSVEERKRKTRVRKVLRHNRTKDAYLQVLARDEVWKMRGANCWFNFSQCLRTRALERNQCVT